MNPGRLYEPNIRFVPFSPIPRNIMINNAMITPRKNYFLSSLFTGIKNYNWKGLLNGANKTINVVNQTIPLIKQAKPMVNNIRSIVKIAKTFKKETNNKKATSSNNKTIINKQDNSKNINNDYPTFFI